MIEIPVQTSGAEPILVAPPKVIVRSRTPNLTHGVVAILPRGGQGAWARQPSSRQTSTMPHPSQCRLARAEHNVQLSVRVEK